ncbi:oligosaccharyl transferase, archaeosortase A system-associated [Natronomonas gomsonensis]|uniref:oligosaccharyl transferase, archaeosortase A system-associated n=1 Tax=Natronomonas gomsonensis TaxID=1046043 RepID=UPI0015BDA950|nr:oligosaccharyl transferase, archaeosortase A system-associated [Natronomonas gomsonensis]
MSQRFDQLEERLDEYESQLDIIYRLYHIPVIVALMAFMLWVRVRNWERFLTDDGALFAGNDAWYHYRSTNYVLENYPFTMPYDVWTGFDTGTTAGQFGTLYDQLIATAILVIGLGDPSQGTIDTVFILAPAVFGVLCAIPLYFLGKRFGGRFGGIVAVTLLALTPGAFLSRSVAGFTDHHVAETLFLLLSLLAILGMLTAAQRDQPIYEFIPAREFEELKRPLGWAVVAGLAMTAYILVWSPGIFLVGILGFVFLVHLTLEYLKGYSPDHVAIPAAVSMVVVAVLMLLFLETTEPSATDYSPVQPLIALTVGVGVLFMAGLARQWDRRDLSARLYPVTIVGIGVVGLGIIAVALPDVFDFLITQFTRVAGLTASDTAATIGEAQAVTNPGQFFYRSYGFAIFTALFGFGLLAYRLAVSDRPKGDDSLIVVFTVFMLLATLTQRRFDYYFVISVAVLNAYVVHWVFGFVDLESVRKDVTNIQPYQVLVVVALLAIVAGPLLVIQAPVAATQNTGPGEVQNWEGSLDWLSDETPQMGSYSTGDEPRLEPYGTYDRTDDFEYESGEYGVMAWWDYGHWITVAGERTPVANPFQQHATESADFLLADNETESLNILEEDSGEAEGVRYVMVDYQLGYAGTTKYNAPTAFESRHDVSSSDVGVTVINQNRQPIYGVHTQRAYESMRVRLYQHHGSAIEPARFVSRFGQYDPENGVATPPEEGSLIRSYNSSEEAREAAQQNPNAIHGGVMGQPSERVEALEHFRLVHGSQAAARSPFERATGQQSQPEPWVKTFERVDGATIEGTGPANSEVEASVEMVIPSTGETFYYNQFAQTDENGNFEMTVPYSTTGYDEYGTEAGYTNTSVRANSSYQFIAFGEDDIVGWTGTADVTEGQVLGEDETAVQVELEEGQQPEGAQQDGTSGGDTNETTNRQATYAPPA